MTTGINLNDLQRNAIRDLTKVGWKFNQVRKAADGRMIDVVNEVTLITGKAFSILVAQVDPMGRVKMATA